MSFKMKCPKCESVSYSVERDNRTYATGKSGELVFSCRCGKQLFGDQLTAEYDRQKAQWDADPARRAASAEREQRQREEEARQEALRQAFEYRRAWVAQKRLGGPPPPQPMMTPPPRSALPGARAMTAEPRRAPELRSSRPNVSSLGAQGAPSGSVGLRNAEPRSEAPSASAPEQGHAHCEWAGCTNAPAANSKYCSRACSNKNARLRHSRRKKGDQEAA